MANNPKGKLQTAGVLAGHYKTGRTFRPPLRALPHSINDWYTDDFPDLLWPVLLYRLEGNEGARLMGVVQALVIELLDEEDSYEFDGRLTSFEQMPDYLRGPFVEALNKRGLAARVVPSEIRSTLKMFEDPPAAWFFLESGISAEVPIDNEKESIQFLVDAAAEVLSSDHANAIAKSSVFGWQVLKGKVSLPTKEMVELMGRYPTVPSEVAEGDSLIKGFFLTNKIQPDEEDERGKSRARHEWAAMFWNRVYALSICIYQEDLEAINDVDSVDGIADDYEDESVKSSVEGAQSGVDLKSFVAEYDRLVDRFLDKAFREAPIDAYNPSQHEVTVAIVMRAARSVLMMVTNPAFWSGEHGAHVMRVVDESVIVLEWLYEQNDVKWFDRFKEYGKGKQKLNLAHIQARPEDEIDEISQRLIVSLKEKLGPYQGALNDVLLDSTFSGISVRQMADEADIIGFYNLAYQMHSGGVHGEWWMLEDYVMERCLNPLHKFHWIPKHSPYTPPDFNAPTSILRSLHVMMNRVLSFWGLEPIPGVDGEATS